MLEPLEVVVASSKGDGTTYSVITSTLFNDAVCECPGFTHRGYCRHIEEVESTKTCDWVMKYDDVLFTVHDMKCPKCGAMTVEYELEPEL